MVSLVSNGRFLLKETASISIDIIMARIVLAVTFDGRNDADVLSFLLVADEA